LEQLQFNYVKATVEGEWYRTCN